MRSYKCVWATGIGLILAGAARGASIDGAALPRTPSDAARAPAGQSAEGPAALGSISGPSFTINIANTPSVDPLFDPANAVILFDASLAINGISGLPVTMTHLGWNITLDTSICPTSWLSDARIYFDGNVSPDPDGIGPMLTPVPINSPGTGSGSSGGLVTLSSLGIPNLLLSDGMLRIEFFESFDDCINADDATYHSTLEVGFMPEPATLLLLGIGTSVVRRRRAGTA
ncbi:MAG: PEP-CTERM sorting domain-containing protein [Phycisphaerae bacterium]